jgi:hypothetical protein
MLYIVDIRTDIQTTSPPEYSVVRSESTVVRQSQGVTSQQIFVPLRLRTVKSNQAASIVGRYGVGHAVNFDKSILGSGDFSIISGGTFYPENDQKNIIVNGPTAQASTSTRKQPFIPENPFINFKDFADLTPSQAAAESASSHIIVTSDDYPKNILEQLELHDMENENEKESKFKLKLKKTMKKKFNFNNISTDAMIAIS